jgi:small-conductance mechanosensitive channel
MMSAVKSPVADWLWKDLYVWPEAKMSRRAYLGALGRILIVYVIFTQVLDVLGPAMLMILGLKFTGDPLQQLVFGQIGALLLIAFPAWSAFQRRANDFRPDHRQRLNSWVVAFPIIFSGLIGLTIARLLGLNSFLDGVGLSEVRVSFALMLVGAAFVPGGEAVPAAELQRGREYRIGPVRSGEQITGTAFMPVPAKAVLPGQAVVIERSYRLPEQGRVKPGWLS